MTAAATSKPTIVFDALGTLFHFNPAMILVEQSLAGEQSATDKSSSGGGSLQQSLAKSFVEDWFHSAQRDFTYLSVSGSYTPIAQILANSLPRQLAIHGLDNSLAEAIVPKLKELPARPGLVEGSALLLAHFPVMAATNGAEESTRNLLIQALGETEGRNWGVWSCDFIKVAKPDPRVYQDVLKGIEERGGSKSGNWFVASHAWDLHAARKAGFRTAFVSYEELDQLSEIWGSSEVVGKDLQDIAEQILKLEDVESK